jgi:hypothetical protein
MRDVVDALEPLLAVCSDVPAGPFVYTVPPKSDDNSKAADEAAAADGAAATAAAARKKCLASAVHAEDELRTAANQRYASSVAGHGSSSPQQSRDRGA